VEPPNILMTSAEVGELIKTREFLGENVKIWVPSYGPGQLEKNCTMNITLLLRNLYCPFLYVLHILAI
jgi:hypothetical protein